MTLTISHGIVKDEDGSLVPLIIRQSQHSVIDIMRRLVSVKDKQNDTEPTNRFTYDIAGRLKEVTRGDETITANYDRVGRLISYTSADSKTVGYEFDNLGRRTKLVYPDNSYITYHYDDIGRLWQIRDDADPYNVIASFTYDDLSRRTSMTLGNGSVTTYDYEDKTGNDNLGDRVEKITIDTNDMELMTFTYTYDAVGNCLTRINNVPLFTYEYTYDDTYRLLEADAPTGQLDETYLYDDVGNWVTQTRNGSHSFSVNSLNQYTAIDGTRVPTYDNSGNMTSNGLNKTYSYDSENRLILTTMGSTSSVEYDYDPFGRRVIKDHDDEGAQLVTRYVYDGPHCIVEYDGDGYWMNKYIYGPGIDEPLMMINISGETQTKYYYHRDALGNVMALSNAANYIVEGYTYSAFGIATVNRSPGGDDDWLTPDGATSSISAFGNPYMFTSRNYDWETGLYYYRARYYDATLGRFISADPISYAGGMNLYAYVNNNPMKWVDPLGLYGSEVHFDLTFDFAEEILGVDLAVIIADANQGWDDSWLTSPWFPWMGWSHFRDDLDHLLGHACEAIAQQDPVALGQWLHQIQDHFAQGNYDYFTLGHILDTLLGKDPDEWTPDSDMQDDLARQITQELLQQYRDNMADPCRSSCQ